MRNVFRYLFIALTTCFFIVANYVNSYHICGCFLTKLIICIWFSLLNLRTHPQRPWSFSWKSLPLNHFFFLWVNILKRIPLRNTMQNFGFPTRGFPRFWRFIYYFFFFFPCLSVTNLRATRAKLHLRKLCKWMGLYSMKNVIKVN